MDTIFPNTLNTIGLFTGYDELLTQDPIKYWRSLSDIQNFFSLLSLSRFLPMQSSFHSVDWLLTFNTFKQSLYPHMAVIKSSIFLQFHLKLWFDELLIMYRLNQRFPGLYADDSLCPNCGVFIEALKHLFICSPSYLDTEDGISTLLNHKDITTNLIQYFLVKLATKVSSSPKCKQTYDDFLIALRKDVSRN